LGNENHKTIKVEDLELGMYVFIPLSWYKHPFLKNQFRITEKREIDKIKLFGLKKIQIDPARSVVGERHEKTEAPGQQKSSESNEQQIEMTKELISSIQDKGLSFKQKAEKVQENSYSMMKNLLDNPSAENIKEAKKGIYAVVDLILKDQDTLQHLINITSYDYYTYSHSVEVGVLSVALAKSLFSETRGHDFYALGAGFFLHDLGKVNISKDIINKPGKLTGEEMGEIRRHPSMGFKLLNETSQLTDESKIIVLQHHERNDGKGYPKGLRGNEIHIYGRICAIADVYNALTTDRPYRKKMTPFDGLKLMREEMFCFFEKDLFERFVLLLRAK
jgi:HD-GYP domain-containing protein (c-di-GMP phosphodiesterase class II)